MIGGPPDATANPRVSVVLCTHNGAEYLDEAVWSIRQQTLAALELIAIDDGSTDGTAVILGRHAAQDPRVRVELVHHRGLAEARNHGLALARSRWVALMDQDDIAAPERLERQLRYLDANPGVNALGTFAWQVGPSGRRGAASDTGPTTREELVQLRAAGKGVYLIAPTVVLDRDVVLAAGGFRQWMFPAEDLDLWLRLSDRGTVLALPERLLDYRVHRRSASSTRFMDQMERILLARENGRRRLAGLPEIGVDEHRALLQAESRWRRFNRARVWRARYLYRVGGSLLLVGRATGVVWLAAAVALSPAIIADRARRQLGARLRNPRPAA
jgi:glycosyltransferase involved in cell wall biosynthesis